MSERITSAAATQHHTPLAQHVYADLEWSFYGPNGTQQVGDSDRAECCTGIQASAFHGDNGYLPRCVEELDAYSDSEELWAEYRSANPAPTDPVAAPVTVADCNRTLTAFGKEAASQTEACYKLGTLATEYIRQCMAASSKALRETATEALATELWRNGEESLSAVFTKVRSRYMDRVSVLLGCNAVVELLGDGSAVPAGNGTGKGRGKGKAGRLPWGKIREFRPLVSRDASSRDERYTVLPNVVEESKALLVEVAVSGLSREDTAAAVAKLVAKDAAAVAEAKRLASQQAGQAELLAAKQKLAAAAERDAKAATVTKATVVASAAEAKVANATGDAEREAARQEAVVAVETLEASKADLITTQATVVAATEAEAKAAADKARLEQEAKDATAKQVDADAKAAGKDKAAKGKKKADATPATVAPTAPLDTREEPKHGNILRSAAIAGTPKDVADMAVELITGGDAPDDVFQAVLMALRDHAELSKASKRAVQEALLALNREERKATVVLPTALAERNGNGVHAKTA